MGKTKTMFVEGVTGDKKSGKEVYEEKIKMKAAREAASSKPEKTKVKSLGLKGGERIKVIGAETPTEEHQEALIEGSVPSTDETKAKIKKAKVRSKNYKSAKAKVDKNKTYKLLEAVKLLKQIAYSKFDETVELHFVTKAKGLNVNVSLPFSGGKEKKVEIATDTTIEKLKKGKVDFDVLLATADMMPKLIPYARMLGPKGLMPNPKNGTLIKTKKDADKFSGNTLTLKTEKEQPVVHTAVGKLSQKDSEIEENTKTVLEAFPKQVVKAYIKSTMSPSLKLQV